MAINDLSPGFVKIGYFRDSVPHTMVLPTKFDGAVTPGVNPNLLLHSSANNTFTSSLSAFNDLLEPMFGPTVTFNSAEVWSKPLPTDDPVWIYSYGMAGTGTNGGAAVTASQTVFTFRSDLGGLLRIYLMETSLVVNQRVSYASMANPYLAFATFVIGQTSWIYARDGGEPISCLQYKTKTNDVLRRRLLTG